MGKAKEFTPLTKRDPEDAKRIRQAGAAATTAINRKRRTLQEIYAQLLALPASDREASDTGASDELLSAAKQAAKFAQGGEKLTQYDLLALAQMARAARGDVQSAAFVRDSVGDKPTDKQEITAAVSPEDVALMQRVAARLEAQKVDDPATITHN
jgi:hypothetical protein